MEQEGKPIKLSRPLKVVRKSRGQIVPPVSDFNLYMDLARPRSSHLDQQKYVGILTFLGKMQNMQLSYAKFFAARYLDHVFRRFLLNPTATHVFAMHAHLG